MMLLSFLDFSKWDASNWAIFAIVVLALIAYWLWPQSESPDAEVGVSEETRKQAKSLIALAADGAKEDAFVLEPMPLKIREGQLDPSLSPDAVRDSLWVCQRAMIQRLESELDYAQQADVSEHFAIAAPANQPATLLTSALADLEKTLGKLRTLWSLPETSGRWRGRALVLLLSNRKLFDHVAWLTAVGSGPSAPGAYTLVNDGTVLMPIYATRLGGFARPLTLQVARAVLRNLSQTLPRWFEEGLAAWSADAVAGAVPQAETPMSDAADILNSDKWEDAQGDSLLYEKMVYASYRVVALLAKQEQAAVVDYFADLLRGDEPSGAFEKRFGNSLQSVLEKQIAAARQEEDIKRQEAEARAKAAREQQQQAQRR